MLQMNLSHTTKVSRMPQTMQASPLQARNNAGGFSFVITPEKQIERFLVLGSTGSSYITGRKATLDNCQCIIDMVKDERMGRYAVAKALDFSITAKASNNDFPLAVLALALTYGTPIVKQDAIDALPQVARIGTHILHFAKFSNELRGWGRALKRAVANWYTGKNADDLGYHIAKYTQRDGFSHRDVMRLAHPKTSDLLLNEVFSYTTQGTLSKTLPKVILGKETLKLTESLSDATKLIEACNLPRECIPTQLLSNVKVWEALLVKMPLGALIRNLNKLTNLGILKPLDTRTTEIAARINNIDNLRKARMHPIQLLFALKTYSAGQGDKGSLTWLPVPEIVTALEQAFYKSFTLVEPSNKRHLIGVDISGSMAGSFILNSNVSCREASIAMALMTARNEPSTYCVAFDSEPTGSTDRWGRRGSTNCVRQITDLTADLQLRNFQKVGGKWNGGATDCSLPMLHAIERDLAVDAFIVYTDNETWAGKIHPHVALKQYQQHSGIQAKLIVVGMTSNGFSVAEPGNPDMLDVVGFSPDTPAVISSFVRGEL